MLTFAVKNVLLGATLLGVVGGVLGCFALLRRQSLLGDALAHAALPGLCLGFLLTGSKSPGPLFAGALAAGVVGSLCILLVTRWSRIKQDTAIGMVLSVFFGVGIVLLTYIQKLPGGNQSGLDKFLFGQAATLMPQDLVVMGLLGGMALVVTLLCYKELKLLAFDRDFGASLGFPMRRLELLLTFLLVTVVVVGLQMVGVVLVIAALVTPAAAARQWTESLGVMLLVAGTVGGAAGATGALLSASLPRLPTGPVIVLCSSAILVVSLLLAPKRGLLWGRLEERRASQRILRENLLKDLYLWGERQGELATTVTWPNLLGIRGQSRRRLALLARRLARRGFLTLDSAGLRLTPDGMAAARRVVRKHRLWELYLTHRLELSPDHVHRDAEAMEHALSEEAVELIDDLLGHPTLDPHGRPIPAREGV
jgi:manganese/zinc/iron transport system permease protein